MGHMEKGTAYVNQTLSKCGYPGWLFKKVRQQLDHRAAKPKRLKKDTKEETKTTTSVTMLYALRTC